MTISSNELDSRIKHHAEMAMTLSRMEPRPPGYDQDHWAAHLVDLSEKDLTKRFDRAVDKVLSAQEAVSLDNLLSPGLLLPEIPRQPPAVMSAKIRSLSRQWLRQTMGDKVVECLVPFIGQKRDAGILHQARLSVEKVLGEVAQQLGQMPFRVNLKMAPDGEIIFELLEPRRR